MSQEFRLLAECPHLTVEEHVPLSDDRRSLITAQPVASLNLVRIMVNDDFGPDSDFPLIIPQGGLFSSAEISGAVSGPFTLLPNKNRLVVRSQTEVVEVDLPLGTRVSVDRVLNRIRSHARTIGADSENSYLVFSDLSALGKSSKIIIEGPAAAAVGFTGQRGSVGKQLFPGWNLVGREGFLATRYPLFNSRVRSNPVFKVTYSAPRESCLRCGGVPVENDLRFDTRGQAILIENENLLYQAALKIILTDKGSNPFQTWYGTRLKSRIGSKSIGMVSSLLSEDVRQALGNLQTLQVQQGRYQQVSFKERLYAIDRVQALPHPDDPSTFFIDVQIRNASNVPVSLSIVFTVPGVIGRQGTGKFFGAPT